MLWLHWQFSSGEEVSFPSPLSILPATAAASRGEGRVVDPHHIDADPNADPASTYHPNADPDPDSDFLFDADPDPTFHRSP